MKASLISNTLENERKLKSNVTQGLLIFCLILNVCLNLITLIVYSILSKQPFNGNVDYHQKYSEHENIVHLYFAIPIIFFCFYVLIAVVYMIVLSRIIMEFKSAYPELFMSIRFRLFAFFFIYQTFIVFRAWNYANVQFDIIKKPKYDRQSEFSYYFFELVFITHVSYIGYYNNKHERLSNAEKESDENLGT